VFKHSVITALLICLAAQTQFAQEWSQFRGPNAAGVANEKDLPVEFGPDKNVVWKTALPAGHSSPVLTKDRLFVTAYEPGKLLVICVNRADGKILWRQEVPKVRQQDLHKSNSPASPSVVTDGQRLYAFFTDCGACRWGHSTIPSAWARHRFSRMTKCC
jgi:outer membrane protein assembly factor BamB